MGSVVINFFLRKEQKSIDVGVPALFVASLIATGQIVNELTHIEFKFILPIGVFHHSVPPIKYSGGSGTPYSSSRYFLMGKFILPE